MQAENTTAVVQRYLDALAGDSPSEAVVRALLDRAVQRLSMLCSAMLRRSYPRLTRPPLNLQTDEMLSAVVERLLKALRDARPSTSASLLPWPASICAGNSMTWPDDWTRDLPPLRSWRKA